MNATPAGAPAEQGAAFDAAAITRPDRSLLTYYLLCSLAAGPLFFIPFLPLYFKYITLRYRFDDEGVSMSWGILFRREVLLTYRRIQDIHLTRNIVQRWMGLATVAVQTAAGSATPEMSIEGILEADALRDFLYARMRGARGQAPATPAPAPGAPAATGPAPADEALAVLTEVRDEVRRLADRLARRGGAS